MAVVFILLLSSIFILGYDFLTQHDYFRAEKIEVDGIRRLTRQAVIDAARITKGANILSINLATTRKRLLAHPLIAEADVRRVFPSRIRLSVREHEPLAILDLGRQFVINTRGNIFREKGPSSRNDLPVITGLRFTDINVPEQPYNVAFNAVMEILMLGQERQSVLPNRMIKRIHVDHEIGLTLYTVDPIKTIKLGYHDYPTKYQRLKNILHFLEVRPGFSDLDSIDLNNLDRIVVNPSRREPSTVDHKEVQDAGTGRNHRWS